MSFDYYQEAEDLINMLSASSLEKYADALRKSMDEGSTGTEILMALRWNLEKMLSEAPISDILRAKAKNLKKEIDNSLG